MAKFRKKPIVIEAVLWDGRSINPMMEFLKSGAPWPKPTDGYVEAGVGFTPGMGTLQIPTLEGTHTANPGDWIIKGVKGEFYPCKPDIFAATYDEVPLSPSDPGYYCDQCPHAVALHNPDGSCPCGSNCAEQRKAAK